MCGSDLLRLGFQGGAQASRGASGPLPLRADVDVVRVPKALGHANVHITLTTYAHAISIERQGVADAMTRSMRREGNNLETSGVRAAG